MSGFTERAPETAGRGGALPDGAGRLPRLCVIYADAPVAGAAGAPFRGEVERRGLCTAEVRDRDTILRLLASDAADVVVIAARRDRDGIGIVGAIRHAGHRAPLVLVVDDAHASAVPALEAGADDVVQKDTACREIGTRVWAAARRGGRDVAGLVERSGCGPVRVGLLDVDLARFTASRDERAVHLRPLEFRLLAALLRREGAVATRAELLAEAWGASTAARSRSLDMHVATLRAKLEPEPSAPRHLITVPRVGYRLAVGTPGTARAVAVSATQEMPRAPERAAAR